jgi:hypothetical protein
LRVWFWQMKRRLAIALLVAGCSGTSTTSSPSPDLRGFVIFTPPTYSCTGNTKMAWTATLTDKVGGLTATEVWALRQSDGTERSLFRGDIAVSSPDFDYLSATQIDVATFCATPYGPGDYVLRLVRPSDSTILATGGFTIAP